MGEGDVLGEWEGKPRTGRKDQDTVYTCVKLSKKKEKKFKKEKSGEKTRCLTSTFGLHTSVCMCTYMNRYTPHKPKTSAYKNLALFSLSKKGRLPQAVANAVPCEFIAMNTL